jgi:hypothetical protein
VGRVTDTKPWTNVSGRIIAPAGAKALRISLTIGLAANIAGTAWFDDFEVVQE